MAFFFAELESLILKFIKKLQEAANRNNLKKKNKIGGLTFLGFKTYYKTV